jgi:hypothetical protein
MVSRTLPSPRLRHLVCSAPAPCALVTISSRGPLCLVEEAVWARSPVLIDIMLNAGPRVKEECASRALIAACRESETPMQRLVAAGADVNYKATSYGRTETPLSAAVKGRQVEIVDILDRAGAQEW